MASIPRCFGTSTCSQSPGEAPARRWVLPGHQGYGYDESIHQHGAWTEQFLVEGLLRAGGAVGDLDLVALFQEAYRAYVARHPNRGDRPCCFGRVGERRFDTNDPGNCEPEALPHGLVLARDVFGC